MVTNLSIDTKLLEDAMKISGLKNKEDTVNLALKEFINSHNVKDILLLFGVIEYDDDYDDKKARRRFQFDNMI